MSYYIKGYDEFVEGIIVSTHPAASGTYLVYADDVESDHRVPVLLWGVLTDASLVPITFDGPWDGVHNKNSFVLHPDGKCTAFGKSWDHLIDAIEEMKVFAEQ